MKTRILTAVIGIPVLLLAILLPWTMVFSCAVAFVAALAVYEVLHVSGVTKFPVLTVVAVAFSAVVPFFNRLPEAIVVLFVIVYVMGLLFLYLRQHKKIAIEALAMAFFSSVYVSFSLSCAAYLRSMEAHGLFYVFLSFGIAWFADAGAYFIGVFFGKHKLCPEISPKKTVEGLFGGFVSSILLTLLMGWIYESLFLKHLETVSYPLLLLLTLLGAALSVVGDLFASLIKRQYDIKDYGNFFPGHGGMMDRFDSLLPVFPLVYFVASYLPLIS